MESLIGKVVNVTLFIFPYVFLNFSICVVHLGFCLCADLVRLVINTAFYSFLTSSFLGIDRDLLFVLSLSFAEDFLVCDSPHFLDVLSLCFDVSLSFSTWSYISWNLLDSLKWNAVPTSFVFRTLTLYLVLLSGVALLPQSVDGGQMKCLLLHHPNICSCCLNSC